MAGVPDHIPGQFDWLSTAKKLESIAQAGLTFSQNPYDLERFASVREIVHQILNHYTDIPFEKLPELFSNETGYLTPKVDVRGVVFKENQILLVREKLDGLWALPGGWADIGLSPGEVVIKEVEEEAGLRVQAEKLLAVLDKSKHDHPPSPYHVYKLFILCAITGGRLSGGQETLEARFFPVDQLPDLSVERNTQKQIQTMFELYKNPDRGVLLD